MGWTTPDTPSDPGLAELARACGTRLVNLEDEPPEPDLFSVISPAFCLTSAAVPWRRQGDGLQFATSNPGLFYRSENPGLAEAARDYVIAPRRQIEQAIASAYQQPLSERANTRCPAQFSSRNWAHRAGITRIVTILVILGTLIASFPVATLWLALGWVLINLAAVTGLRLTALCVQSGLLKPRHPSEPDPGQPGVRPVVSILVPLYHESAILPDLLRRLSALRYPAQLLDICLVVETDDSLTRSALKDMALAAPFRVITVPKSALQTKPRAMNYALDFCYGDIIGIYDAEDAPEPDQIDRMVAAFAASGPEVACIQGYLDFYNARFNWLSRCFTIEYASWFRVVLHGLEKLGLPIPLGGTTVFFRRPALERLGAWDAHNVTEDADLGFRLARLGYRCGFLSTTTHEEANCFFVPWIKQRSRWLKGYAVTWITHMQNPVQLFRELGPLGFLTFQVLMLGTFSTFLLAPVVWSFILFAFGFDLPLVDRLPDLVWRILGAAFILSEVVSLLVGLFAVSGPAHRHLIPFVPLMPFYWPLGTIAVLKALYELLFRPFYWDKTAHGHHQVETSGD